MRYLHSCYCVHGSLSSRNCVIDARWVLKITDYGLREFYEAQNIAFPHKMARGNFVNMVVINYYLTTTGFYSIISFRFLFLFYFFKLFNDRIKIEPTIPTASFTSNTIEPVLCLTAWSTNAPTPRQIRKSCSMKMKFRFRIIFPFFLICFLL